MRTKYQIWQWLILITTFFISTSCAKDRLDTPGGNGPEKGEDIVFSITLPTDQAMTKGLDGKYETKVDEIRMLVFDVKGGTSTGDLQHVAYPKELTYDPANPEKRKYRVKLKAGTWDLMLLANSGEYLDALYPNGLKPNTSREEIIKGLQVEIEGKWNVTPGSVGYKDFPMAGVRTNVTIDDKTDLRGEKGFRMNRAVAKINVTLNLPQAEKDNFKMADIRFYHRRKKAQIIPNESEWNTLTGHVNSTSLVDNNDTKGPLEYTSGETECVDEIYVFEAPMGNLAQHPAYPCLVVGGYYKGELGYYRVDFANDTDKGPVFMPLLRNHLYDIQIVSVTGPGFPDPEEAYKSLPVNLESNILQWKEGEVGDIYFNGQNYLCIDQGRYNFTPDARLTKGADNKIFIKTDDKSGWEYEGITYEGTQTGWLEFKDGNTGLPDKNEERWLQVTENLSNEDRVAWITIRAGRIKGKIQVTQSAKVELKLTIFSNNREVDDGYIFNYESDIWTSHRCDYAIECFPKGAEIQVSLVNPINGYEKILFKDESEVLKQGILTGKTLYEFGFDIQEFNTAAIKEAGLFSFPSQGLEYKFTAKYGSQTVTRSFQVRNKLLDLQSEKPNKGSLQGRTYTFNFEYNTDWKLDDIENRDIFEFITIPPLDMNVTGKKSGTCEFKLKTGKEYDGREATIRFLAPTTSGGPKLIYDEVKITSYYNHPNSYMVKPGSQVQFPITKAFRMWGSEHINSPLGSGTLEVAPIWWDQGVSVAASLSSETNPWKKTMTVNTYGYEVGNAVIGLFLNGEIIWSWHIWVTNLDPNSYITYVSSEGIHHQIMARNLGAKSDYLGSSSNAFGTYYQWGRKDPFPTCATYDRDPPGPVGSGGNVSVNYKPGYYVETSVPSSSNNLTQSIRYPNLFFKGVSEPYDWYSSDGSTYNNELWLSKDGLKTEFDPCPEGWRIANYFWMNGRYHYTFSFTLDGAIAESNYGWRNTQIGIMPKAGYIDHKGDFKQVATECRMWYGVWANENKYTPLDERRGLSDVSWGAEFARGRKSLEKAAGVPVRCKREDSRYLVP